MSSPFFLLFLCPKINNVWTVNILPYTQLNAVQIIHLSADGYVATKTTKFTPSFTDGFQSNQFTLSIGNRVPE